MKCPLCATWSDVLSTRETPAGPRRRRECANGHRFTTLEQVQSRAALLESRNKHAARLVLAGHTITSAAARMHMPRSELSRWMTRHHPEHDGRSAGQLARWARTKG